MVLVTLVGCIQAVDKYWDYIVVGAGPGGLQMGHFLQKAGRNYVLLERNSVVGKWVSYVVVCMKAHIYVAVNLLMCQIDFV